MTQSDAGTPARTQKEAPRWPETPAAPGSSAAAPSELEAARSKAAASGEARDLAHYLELRRLRRTAPPA